MILDQFRLDGRNAVVTGASSGIVRAMAGFLADAGAHVVLVARRENELRSGALGDLGWIEQRPLSAGADAFSELLQGQCAAPRMVLQTAWRRYLLKR
jgi:NAD(P)-dependent dehydrogenase (short-subunit alcohol dehydrogenase family)